MLPFISRFGFLLILTSSSIALVPHSFWSRKRGFQRSATTRSQCGLFMYFDDCERHGVEEWEPWLNNDSLESSQKSPSPWRHPIGEEKRSALDRYLGYNQESTSALSIEEIEEATLIWAVDCDIVGVSDDESDNQESKCKYSSISDLLVASKCSTVTDCLAVVWTIVAKLFEKGTTSEDGEGVQLIAFPKALWEYETMVTMLDTIEICKPLLPSNTRLKIDLFHPDYKHAPKMWSPQTHSPFPTIGIQVLSIKNENQKLDNDAARDKLRILFDSFDAVIPTTSAGKSKTDITAESIMIACQNWAETVELIPADGSITWNVEMHKDPYQIYKSLWTEIQKLPTSSSSLIVAPYLDAHTTHRLAVTVNAALRRFDSPMRISHVFHPDGPKHLYCPYPIIQIVGQAKVGQ